MDNQKFAMKALYKGLVQCGNIGDDILFYIYLEMVKLVLKTHFGINDVNITSKQNSDNNYDVNDYDIYIIGGGSIIHPMEISYTNFSDSDKLLFVNGTGITHCNKINIDENNIYKILDNKDFSDFLFTDKLMEINFSRIRKFQFKNNMYGGFRGLYEKQMYHFYANENIDHINDIGLLSHILNNNDTCTIDTNRKIVLINPITISAIDALKEKELSYDEYNDNIDQCLIALGVYLVKNGYFVHISDFFNSKNKYYYDSIIKELNLDEHKYVDYFNDENNIDNILCIIKQSYIVVGTRFHASVIANSFKIPTLTIAYGIKNINYAVTNNMEKYCVPSYKKHLTAQKLIETFKHIENNYDRLKSQLTEMVNNCFNAYCENIKSMLSTKIQNVNDKKCCITYELLDNCNARFDINIC